MESLMHFLILICVLTNSHSEIAANEFQEQSNLETYIVHVELPDPDDAEYGTNAITGEDLESLYNSFLPTTATTAAISNATLPHIVYSYHNVFKGFAAKLSAEDVKEIEKKPGFVSARQQKLLSLCTTHTPSFLGLHQNLGLWKESNCGKGVIIGILDTGIVPDHPSFSDEGMPAPPAKWKGRCEFNSSVCNNKLIGARYFHDGNGSPLDETGHGTHTASIAAGNYVQGANVFGNANGTAVGIAPLAHLAMYKVCTAIGCFESDILAAMDAAIEDGVDIISASLVGGDYQFYANSLLLGAYSATERGIFVSCSAGNDGPSKSSLSNEAPWVLTVGASTIDRNIRATAVLGNKEEFQGETINQLKDFPPTLFPLFYPGKNQDDIKSKYCASKSLNNTEVRGKIVVCIDGGTISGIEKGENIKAGGGVGMILINHKNDGYTTFADAHVLPATDLSYADGLKVIAYINSTESPMAAISFKGTVFGDNHAPMVASFSSRGPSRASPGILKPDIIGPGVNILAAWRHSIENNTNTKFNVLSGTSMSCPHLSGVAALLKSVHPNWSPAAIKSAILTTADLVNCAKNPIEDQRHHPANIFATGWGHVNPSKATNPGLIYDIDPKDYIPYLCGLNYTNREIGILLKRKVNCAVELRMPEAQLNYPSFSIIFGSPVQRYTRTVTNVDEANSTYTVKIIPPAGVNLTVEPTTLGFSQANQKLTYEVTFTLVASPAKSRVSQGSLSWTSTKFSVRSPIVATINGK
ncbi:subtilisin-like protease [Coffea arabica]|uniref:Subtilisin-like protease n=1 Tax=Coffea arabica TaxID=13443 RepID=A0A6P6U6G8_COFAR|nr:subtilisin-like protease SBT1.7 [Coffea arabica]